MGKSLVVVVMLAACQPMYERPPQKLKNPVSHRGPATTTTEQQPVYDDNCPVDFSAPPVAKRPVAKGDRRVGNGEGDVNVAPKAETPQEALRRLEGYRATLIADPYNAEATLELALAYDRFLRRGCAIAMLKRLERLAQNPKFKAEAQIDRVVYNEQWFKPYRQDALRALGH